MYNRTDEADVLTTLGFVNAILIPSLLSDIVNSKIVSAIRKGPFASTR